MKDKPTSVIILSVLVWFMAGFWIGLIISMASNHTLFGGLG